MQETWKIQNQNQVYFCVFWKPNIRTNKLDVQKQTSISHSSTEAELFSLDAGLRMDEIPALDLWDLVKEVFHSSPTQSEQTKDIKHEETRCVTPHQISTPKTKMKIQPSTTILS